MLSVEPTVLSVEPMVHYLLSDPDDPVAVWNKLSSQFQKKSWANKLQLRKKLYSLVLKEGNSVQEHIQRLLELFEELAVVGSPGPSCSIAAQLTRILQHPCYCP